MLKLSFLFFTIAAFSSFAGAQTATLTCDFYTHTVSCNLTDITSANQPIVLAGESESYVNTTIAGLNFYNPSKLTYVPTGIFKIFPKLTRFMVFRNVQMTTLVTDAFTNCDELHNIEIFGNDIQTVPAAFAQKCEKLHSIILAFNNISSIHVDAFKGLKMLYILDMTNNSITCIPSGLFRHSLAISSINFSENKITAFDPKTFTYLPALSRMFFMQNPIKYLHNLDFTRSGMVEGILFHISSDSLVAVDPEFISNTALNCCGPKSFTIHIMSQSPLNESIGCAIYNVFPNFISPYFSYYNHYMHYNYPYPYNVNMRSPALLMSSNNWVLQNMLMEPCYANWTSTIAKTNLPCETAPSTIRKLPCCCDSNVFEATTTMDASTTTTKFETTKIGTTTKCAATTKKPKKGNGKSKSSSE